MASYDHSLFGQQGFDVVRPFELKRREYSKLLEPWRQTEKHLRDEYNKLTENIPPVRLALWASGACSVGIL